MAIELEKHLVLNKYFLNFFGFSDFNELGKSLTKYSEDYDSKGRSYFINALIGLKPAYEDLFSRYDQSIKEYVEKLKYGGQPNFSLKYFQYLAILFTEIFLDKYFNNKERFINELNEFLNEFNTQNKTQIEPFKEENFKKLAFWMATGSGKTFIMHINYWQILKYSNIDWDNILLITPNEGLSKQHCEKLKSSGIPCKLYEGDIKTDDEEILVIDIHKLTKEKKGEGVSVDISYFDGKNLVFIDEGHKGAGGESETGWKEIREEIAKNGFIFEYSATFGQIIEFTSSGKPKESGINSELYNEYTKAIIFNYSYKYFYDDGYGKDFYVYNIKEDEYTEEHRDLLLTANLLSFYEQLVIFENHKEYLRDYNIQKPLWVFFGSKVTGKDLESDVVRIIQFLDKIIKDKNYLKNSIKKILEERSGLIDAGNDIFKNKFKYIRNTRVDEIIEDIYQKVFNSNGNGKFELYLIKNATGEIGLKIGTGEKYFGVINVGDVRALKKLISGIGIEVKEDHFSQSLFSEINKSNSHINILIGSKKFIEGWDSWRVSNMGLINMGKGEGPQIIQLFGRGVRLKGKNDSLEREKNPDYKLAMLQTLSIFGLNANYINAFLTAITKEGVKTDVLIPVKIRFNNQQDWEGKIYTIKTQDSFDFHNYHIKLTFDENLIRDIEIDLRPRITLAHGLSEVRNINTSINQAIDISDDLFNIVDWDFIYSEAINYKIIKEFYNLTFDKEILKEIIKSKKYQIFLGDVKGIKIERNNNIPVIKIMYFYGINKLQDIFLMIIKNYIEKFYNKERKIKTMDYLEAEPLSTEHKNMFPEGEEIILRIPKKLINDFQELINEINNYNNNSNTIPDIYRRDIDEIPTIHFDKHLYTPLVVYGEGKEEIRSIPVKLNKGETNFVKDLISFLNQNRDLFVNNEIFLLRNLSKRGIGFFISSGFYPDFIIWVKNEDKQNIIFVDPKGIRNLGNFNNEKVQFCKNYIKEIENRVNQILRNRNESIQLQLDAFILSVTPYSEIKEIFGEGNHDEKEFKDFNILFQEDNYYIKDIFEIANVIRVDR